MPNKISQLARSESGHNLAVAVTFQFLLVVRPVIELSGRYSAIKLMTSLPQPGQLQTFAVPPEQSFRGPVQSETCLTAYECSSVKTASRANS